MKHRTAWAAVILVTLMLVGAAAAFASSVEVAVVDVTAPTGSVTLSPAGSGNITINVTVTGKQEGTATFKVNRDWTLKDGSFTGSNPQEFTVAAREAQDPATSFSTSGTVTVDATQAAGTFTLAVGAFGIWNSNDTRAKLADGADSSYTVIVEAAGDTTPPVITVPADITVEATGPTGAVVTFSASANDAVDGPVDVECKPASGSTFGLGDTLVHVYAKDKAGNESVETFKVTVVDTTAPEITVPADITAEATGPDGTVVTFAYGASDLVDADPAVSASPDSGSTFPLGTTTVTVTATDASGNSDSKTFTVEVADTTPPVITVPANMNVKATGPDGAVVTFAYGASDLVDADPAVSASPDSGSTFPLGTTTVTVTATDASGNSDSKTFTVSVLYDFNGFFRPVDNPDVVNAVKAGSAIPVKFNLGGDMGLNILAAGYPKSSQFVCSSGAPLDSVEETVTAGASSLTYDASASQYIYVWKTDKAWAGTCRKLEVKLADGTSHVAWFKFTK